MEWDIAEDAQIKYYYEIVVRERAGACGSWAEMKIQHIVLFLRHCKGRYFWLALSSGLLPSLRPLFNSGIEHRLPELYGG